MIPFFYKKHLLISVLPMQNNESNLNNLMSAYSTISEYYIRTKRKPWKDFKEYLLKISNLIDLSKKHLICDVGGGNGRNLLLFQDYKSQFILCDLSFKLLKNSVLLPNSANHLVNLEMTSLPFRKESYDLVLSIAAIHHLNNQTDVICAFTEIKKILQRKGFFILSVWYKWKKDTRLKMILDLILFPIKKLFNSNWRFGDYYLPWKNSEGLVIAKRYYHLFSRRELVKLIRKTDFKIVDISLLGGKSGKDNIFVLLQNN